MLKHCFFVGFLSFSAIALAPFASYSPASAASTFDAQEVDRDQVIAIARPYGDHKYDLLILKQIPGQRQCWQEQGNNPTTITPLLLNFDFTGICERSTDSNGYSMRVDGQDLGLDYLLRIVERNGELWLVGTPRQNKAQGDVALGRTHGLSSGFLKIILEPGWRFTSRAYQGRVLSHIYLTGDRSALQPLASPADTTATLTPRIVTSKSAPSNPSTLPIESEPAESQSPPLVSDPLQEVTFSADPSDSPLPPLPVARDRRPTPTEVATPTQPLSRSLPPLPVAPRTSAASLPLPPLPVAPRTSTASLPPPPLPSPSVNNPDDRVTPSFSELPPLPPPPSPTQTTPSSAPTQGRKTLSDILTLSSGTGSSPSPSPSPTTDFGRVPQPSSLRGGSTLSPSPTLAQQPSYRVLVNPGSQQAQVRSLYPDAFVTSYQGRSLWQIGRFGSQENAQKALSDLESLGIRGLITP